MGLKIHVATNDSAALDWLLEFLTPSFRPIDEYTRDCTVYLRVDTDAYNAIGLGRPREGISEIGAFLLDTSVVRLPTWRGQNGQRIIFDDRLQAFYVLRRRNQWVEIVTAPGNWNARFALMRVVREFAMNSLSETSLLVHGAAFAFGQHGVLIAGPKRAGKTTLLMHCLRTSDADFVSNDRVVISLRGSDLVLQGLPTIITLRDRTFSFFPALKRPILERFRDFRLTDRETPHPNDGLYPPPPGRTVNVSPKRFCDALTVNMRDWAPVRTLLFPRITNASGGLDLRRISAPAASELLKRCLFATETSSGPSHAFQPMLRHSQPNPREERLLALTTKLACFECNMGDRAYREPLTVNQLLS